MARSRNIKPGFYKNEDLAECSIWARYIYPGLWMLADREGRIEDRPKRIKAELLPMDSQDVEPLLVELAERGFIVRFQVGGQAVIWIPAFLKHQNPHHREQPSELPPHPSLGLEPDSKDRKPEAFPSMGPKPGASTPLQVGKAVLNPSSLIPSYLNPSSLIPENGKARADANGDFLGDPPPRKTENPSAGRTFPGQVTFAMKRAGMQDLNPAHPKLQALIDSGATVDEFVEAAKKAVAGGKGFGYALAIVEGQRKDAAAIAGQLHTGPLPPKPAPTESFRERDSRLAAERMAEFAPRIALHVPVPIEQPRSTFAVEPPNVARITNR